MAISNALFAKLRDFITLRLPPGFPVKIGTGGVFAAGTGGAASFPPCFFFFFPFPAEIPIFHILNARITFGNLNGCDEPVSSLRHSPSSEAPSPSSDSSSVSSSSSLSTWGRGGGGDTNAAGGVGMTQWGPQPYRRLFPRSLVPGVRDGPGTVRGAAGVQRGGYPPGRPAGG